MDPSGMTPPIMVLVLWTLVVWLWMYATRIPAMQKAGIDPQDAARTRSLNLPPETMYVSDNYNHLMEQPTIFYATALAAHVTGQVDGFNMTLAWAYVLLRGILCPGPDCDVARIAADTSIGCLNDNECLRVTVRRRVEFAFARGLGVPSQLVTATATARAGRELPHRAGIITTGIDSHSGLDVMDGPAGTVQVVGDVVSNDLFNVHGASRLNLVQGRAFLPPSGTLTGGGRCRAV